MKKETIIAIVLTLIVWMGWFYFFAPKPETAESVQTAEQQAVEDVSAQEQTQTGEQKKGAVYIPSASNLKEAVLPFETEKYKGTFSSKGAVISDIEIKGLREENIPATVKESGIMSKEAFDFSVHFTGSEFTGGNDLDSTVWKVDENRDGRVSFLTRITVDGTPLNIRKTYILSEDSDSFRLEYSFSNIGKKDIYLPEGRMIFSPADMVGPRLDYENRYNTMQGIYSVNGSYDTITKGGSDILKKEEGAMDWAGIASRYLLLIMLPQEHGSTQAYMDNRENYGFRTGLSMPVDSIRAGSVLEKNFTVYLGPKDKNRLAATDPRLTAAADISTVIEPIRYFVIWCLMKINSLTGNIGWALVIFSIITKLVFMPLTNKSTSAMKKMSALTPKINAIKAKYKDKPDLMQREIMAMYKENKVNPMSGCLPLLVQMPFFFALYSALINSIDLWHAPFILWMKDLSMPDTLCTLGGFDINILPLIFTVSTVFQQKLTTVDTGQPRSQKMMMYLMPVIFLFIFWTIPSGLVLYWTLQNVFQVANQLIVNRIGKKTA